MQASLAPVVSLKVPCKCCATLASLYGVVDFHRSCADGAGRVLPLSGVPIYYHRCPECGFLFTTAFDRHSPEDLRRDIYNDGYVQVDPDVVEARPSGNAALIEGLFSASPGLRVLDYGGGTGQLGRLLCRRGFSRVDTYDPFVPEHSARPSARYECIVSFEVLEHTPRPLETLAEIDALLADDGLVLFSTLLQPEDLDQQGMSWWYIGPRNGHVSLYSRGSLHRLIGHFGFQLGSFNSNLHVLFRKVPDFARHLLQPG